MKQHYTIVKTEWLYENLNSEAIASFDSKDDAEHYFNSIVKDFSAEMEESYTACNYRWVEDFKVYCYCNEGCAELALLASSDDESAKRKIVSIIKHLGEVWTTDTEKYVDIYAKIKMNDMELAQMVYFGDTATLSAYFLDNDNEGHFYDWNDIDENTQKEISNLAIWDWIMGTIEMNIENLAKDLCDGFECQYSEEKVVKAIKEAMESEGLTIEELCNMNNEDSGLVYEILSTYYEKDCIEDIELRKELFDLYQKAADYIGMNYSNSSQLDIINEAADIVALNLDKMADAPSVSYVLGQCMCYINKDFEEGVNPTLEEYVGMGYELVEKISGTLGWFFE